MNEVPPLSLIVIQDGRESRHPLPARGRVTIGRASDCEIRIHDSEVGEHHLAIHVGPGLGLEVLDTSLETTLLGRTVPPGHQQPLVSGDTFSIGPVQLTVHGGPDLNRVWTASSFEEHLEEACARARAGGDPLAVLRLRVSPGIPEDVLEASLRSSVRLADRIGRYDGRDYAVLLGGVPPQLIELIARRIERHLRESEIHARLECVCVPRDPGRAIELMGALAERLEAQARVPDQVPSPRSGMQQLIEKVAESSISVLILGETGVGKEVCAEKIHRGSPRSAGNFLRLNCAALSETLLQSELFGHERGAFTGAFQTKPGLLEMAQGGTVFLDEVGELPLPLQAMLLRVIDERKVLRVGGLEPRSIDVRLISATNRDLAAEVQRGRFREDLYYRLNGFSISIPPLRERTREIPDLAAAFIAEACRREKRSTPPRLSGDALALLLRYAWPGNVRELKNVIGRALILAGHAPEISAEHFSLDGKPHPSSNILASKPAGAAQTGAVHNADGERARILDALERTGGNQTAAAKLLGMPRRTFVKRLDTYGLPRPRKGSTEGEGRDG